MIYMNYYSMCCVCLSKPQGVYCTMCSVGGPKS